MNNDNPNEISLQEMMSHIERAQSPELYAGVLIAARLVIEYFNKPPFEISLTALKGGRRIFPLYLSQRRVPLQYIDAIANEVDSLIDEGDAIERRHRSERTGQVVKY